MNKIVLTSVISAVLAGCGGSSSPTPPTVDHGDSETNLYFAHASAYPRATMIGMMSKDADDTNDKTMYWTTHGKGVGQITDSIQSMGSLADIPLEEKMDYVDSAIVDLNLITDRLINVVLEESIVRYSNNTLSSEALTKVKGITIVLEGSGSITATDKTEKIIELAESAQNAGVETFTIYMFDTIDLGVLHEQRPQWAELLDHPYINVTPFSFKDVSREISTVHEIDTLTKLTEYFDYDLKNAFVKAGNYDPAKKLLVFFGSSRTTSSDSEEGRKGGDYNNMLLADFYAADSDIQAEYNVAIKPHYRLPWINKYIKAYHQETLSYFNNIPYEVLVLGSGKSFGGNVLPEINRVDSTYSTLLFSVDKKVINTIVDYSDYLGFYSEKDNVDYMKSNYSLLSGWSQPSKEILANDMKEQINAPHIKVTNVYDYINAK